MGRRRKAREETLRILFRLEFENKQIEKTLNQYWESKKTTEEIKEYSTWLVNGIISDQEKIDNIIQQVSEHWRISRMAIVDRNILRMAVFELLYEKNIAPAIIINEAIEIAKKYSGDEAATFVNGILDAIRKNLKDIKKSLKDKEHA
ncbi:MAG: transcription antitermination factor NusB [Candidatus Aminicenantes bacterium]|nr:transcription antitermination factor NusB [Candidatus Aminicenantes bacterium]